MEENIPISRFRGEYKWLSNFAESPFNYEGERYLDVEHAYQERKFLDPGLRMWVREAPSPMEAARRGRSKPEHIRPNWINAKSGVMLNLVREKFKQNPVLAGKLLATGNRYLFEGNYWHDNFFGICCCKKCHEGEQGQNHLGRILMFVRDELISNMPDE